MKLAELFQAKRRSLQEALELDWVFDLHEVLNTTLDDEAWEQKGDKEVGTGVLEGETYKIYLEPGTYPAQDQVYRFINVAFQKIVNGEPTEELQWNSKNASKVVGAISNALLKRVQLYDYDAVIFIASDNVDKRMSIYNKIAERKWTDKGLGKTLENVPLGDGRMATLLLSKALAKEKLEPFLQKLKSLKKLT
jgi:hypothetical protein